MLLLSSRAGTQSTSPFFFAVAKGVSWFYSFVLHQFLLDKYEILQPFRTDSAL